MRSPDGLGPGGGGGRGFLIAIFLAIGLIAGAMAYMDYTNKDVVITTTHVPSDPNGPARIVDVSPIPFHPTPQGCPTHYKCVQQP